MEMKQVSDNCFAVLNEKNRVCDANSGLIIATATSPSTFAAMRRSPIRCCTASWRKQAIAT